MSEKTEFYKTITTFPNYEISNLKNVRNKTTGLVLKPIKDKYVDLQRVTTQTKLIIAKKDSKSVHCLIPFTLPKRLSKSFMCIMN